MELDYKKMIKEINELVENDFCSDMECKLIPNSQKYKQEEAEEMANKLAKIYSISHCIHCKACQDKYLKQ